MIYSNLTPEIKQLIEQVADWVLDNMVMEYDVVFDTATEPDGTFQGGLELQNVEFPQMFKDEDEQYYFEDYIYEVILEQEKENRK